MLPVVVVVDFVHDLEDDGSCICFKLTTLELAPLYQWLESREGHSIEKKIRYMCA